MTIYTAITNDTIKYDIGMGTPNQCLVKLKNLKRKVCKQEHCLQSLQEIMKDIIWAQSSIYQLSRWLLILGANFEGVAMDLLLNEAQNKHGCLKQLFIDFLNKMSYCTSQVVGDSVQIIKYVEFWRFNQF